MGGHGSSAWRGVMAVMTAVLLACAAPAWGAPGGLDPSFGTNGVVTVAAGGQPWLNVAGAPATLADGSVAVAAWRRVSTGTAGLFVVHAGGSGWTLTDTLARRPEGDHSAAIARIGDVLHVASGAAGGARLQQVSATTGAIDAGADRVVDVGGSGTVARAPLRWYGKHRFAAETLARNDFDAKASEQFTFYGLPTYRIGPVGKEARAAMYRASAFLGRGPANALSDRVTVDSQATRVDTAHGTFWAEPQTAPVSVAGRPVQPVAARDVTSPLGRAHGALVTGLVSRDVGGITPKVASPTIDRVGEEPARAPGDVAFPQSLATITTTADVDGLRDRLLVATGQFIGAGGTGTQRLFDRVEVEVLRSASTDFTPPRIVAVSGALDGAEIGFAADTAGGDVARATVLFQEAGSAAWRRVDLAPAGDGRWTTRVALTPGATAVPGFIVQAADEAGNVATATGKGAGNATRALAPPSPDAATVALEGSKAGPVFTEDVTAHITGGTLLGLETRVDDGAPVIVDPNDTTTPVEGEGPHVLELTSVDEETGEQLHREVLAAVDELDPTIAAAPERTADVVQRKPAGCAASSHHPSRSAGAAQTPPPASPRAPTASSSTARRPGRPAPGPPPTASAASAAPPPAIPSRSTSLRPPPRSRPSITPG